MVSVDKLPMPDKNKEQRFFVQCNLHCMLQRGCRYTALPIVVISFTEGIVPEPTWGVHDYHVGVLWPLGPHLL